MITTKPPSPRFIRYFPSQKRKDEHNITVGMFVEDVHLAIMPIGGRSRNHPDFKVSIEGTTEETKRASILLASLSRYESSYRSGRTQELICEAVEQVAISLSHDGLAYFELIPYENSFSLSYFTSERLVRFPGYFFQIIPRVEYKRIKKRIISLSSKYVWKIGIPSSLGGYLGYRKLIRKLRRYDSLGPKFWQSEIIQKGGSPGFDLKKYSRDTQIYYSKVTHKWGWNRRDYSQQNSTEYYTIYKSIKFKMAQALLREHIVHELNSLLCKFGIEAKVVVSDIPTARDIEGILRKLNAGEISMGSAYDQAAV